MEGIVPRIRRLLHAPTGAPNIFHYVLEAAAPIHVANIGDTLLIALKRSYCRYLYGGKNAVI